MKSIPTPWTHTAITAEELRLQFFGGSRLPYDVTVPAGTLCHKLEGGSNATWVVADLSFISDKKSFLYHDADNYGIRVGENQLKDIYPAGMTRDKVAAEIRALSDARKAEIDTAVSRGANEVDRRDRNSSLAFMRGATDPATGNYAPVLLSGHGEIAYAEAAIAASHARSNVQKTTALPSSQEIAYFIPNGNAATSQNMHALLANAGLSPQWQHDVVDGLGDRGSALTLSQDDLRRLWHIQEINPARYGNAPSADKQALYDLLTGEDRAILMRLRNGHADTRDEFVEKKLRHLAETASDPASPPSAAAEARRELAELCSIPRSEDLRRAMERYTQELAAFDEMKLADYDARQLGADDKPGKEYRGTVTNITENHVVQSIGPKEVSHLKTALSSIPSKGESIVVKYGKDRKATVTARNEQSQVRASSRSR